jgi:hypothetical protein
LDLDEFWSPRRADSMLAVESLDSRSTSVAARAFRGSSVPRSFCVVITQSRAAQGVSGSRVYEKE